MQRKTLIVGTHPRAQRTDGADVAFGIYSFALDVATHRFTLIGLTPTASPGWIAVHPEGRLIYAVNEVADFEGEAGGGVSAFSLDPGTGFLRALNTRRTGRMPAHCSVDASGRFLLVACVGDGTVHLFPLMADGRLGPEADRHQHVGSSVHQRQGSPHAHEIAFDPAHRFVLVPDLGTDEVLLYELDRDRGLLVSRPDGTVRLPPGSGPRHIAFHPDGRFAFLMNELSSTVTAFAFDASTGALRDIQVVDLLPQGFSGQRLGAEVAVHPSGRFLYASTRSHGSSGPASEPGLDSIVWFGIDEEGLLTFCGRMPSGGTIPRSFVIDDDGDLLLVGHQGTGTVVTFRIDQGTGALSRTGATLATPVPVCLRLLGAR